MTDSKELHEQAIAKELHEKMCEQDISGYLKAKIDCAELAKAALSALGGTREPVGVNADEVAAWRAKAALLRSRGKNNSLHDILQAADYLDRSSSLLCSVNVPFVADCLRNYVSLLTDGGVDGAGHYLPSDINEAADDLERAALEPSAHGKGDEAKAEDLLELIRWAHNTLYEINPSNYDHDEVCKLNDASVEVILGLAPVLGETHGKTDEWWAARGVTPQAPVSAVVEALKDIASQKTYAEMPADVRDDLDFVGGYEMCVNLARSALASPPPPAQADTFTREQVQEHVNRRLEEFAIAQKSADDGKDAEIARLKQVVIDLKVQGWNFGPDSDHEKLKVANAEIERLKKDLDATNAALSICGYGGDTHAGMLAALKAVKELSRKNRERAEKAEAKIDRLKAQLKLMSMTAVGAEKEADDAHALIRELVAALVAITDNPDADYGETRRLYTEGRAVLTRAKAAGYISERKNDE